jgi:hypothetical protein
MPQPVTKHSRRAGSAAVPVAGWLMGKPEPDQRGRVRTRVARARVLYGALGRDLGQWRGARGARGGYRGGFRAPLAVSGRARQEGGRGGRWSSRGGRW